MRASASASVLPVEYLGLISSQIEWFDCFLFQAKYQPCYIFSHVLFFPSCYKLSLFLSSGNLSTQILKNVTPGFPQWSSGQDSMLPLKGIQAEFPKGRFAYHASSACHAGGQNKKSKKSITPVIIPVLSNNFFDSCLPMACFSARLRA